MMDGDDHEDNEYGDDDHGGNEYGGDDDENKEFSSQAPSQPLNISP